MIDRYCAIIPDRGDRPEFTEHCLNQLAKHDWIQPIHVKHKPLTSRPDLVERIKNGVESAKLSGFTHAFIVENDDWYHPEYFQKFTEDFVGYFDTVYYHIKNKTWERTTHPGHSSLFTTAFKISALDNFKWPRPDAVFLDIELWKYAMTKNYTIRKNNPCIGIKHGIGMCGGMGHRQTFPNKDYEMKWLASKVDHDSLELYKELGRSINTEPLIRR